MGFVPVDEESQPQGELPASGSWTPAEAESAPAAGRWAFVDETSAPAAPIEPPPTLRPVTSDPNASPGYGTVIYEAGRKGLQEGGQEVVDFLQAAQARVRGDAFFQPAAPHEVPSEADELLSQKVSEGWSNPKWWTAQVAYGAGRLPPIMAGAAAGGAVAGLPGAVGGAAAAGGALRLVPAFRQAKERGLSDDDAIEEAAKLAAIEGGTLALMGGFGAASGASTAVAKTLAHPIREAFLQMGIIQPTIGAAGNIAGAAVQGRDATLDEVATGVAGDLVLGAAFTLPHIAAAKVAERARPAPAPTALPEATPLGAEVSTEITVPGYRFGEGVSDLEVPQADAPIFFSQVKQLVEKGPNSAPASQWSATIRNAQGLKAEELQYLGLPRWLEEQNGKVSKEDLLAHIEEKQIRLEEVTHEDYAPELGENTRYSEYTLPGPKESYGELKLYMPVEAEVVPPTGTKVFPEVRTKGEVFEAPHFKGRGPERLNENLLAWVRYTGRLDRDSKRTLFLEEMQSDWLQQGREKGFKPRGGRDLDAIQAEWKGVIDQFDFGGPGRTSLAGTPEGRALVERMNALSAEAQAATRGVPDAPFKTSWPELLVKRMLRFAADNGFERIAWTNGEQQVTRWRGAGPEAHRGMREFYDQIVPRLFTKWAKKLGMAGGDTKIMNLPDFARPDTVRYVDVSPAAGSRIKLGLPLFDLDLTNTNAAPFEGRPHPNEVPGIRASAHQAEKIAKQIMGRMGLENVHFQYVYHPEKPNLKGEYNRSLKTIGINLAAFTSPDALFATTMHEVGHHIMYTKFEKLPLAARQAIYDAYKLWRARLGANPTFGVLETERRSAASRFALEGRASLQNHLSDFSETSREYLLSFREFFAEQTAKWATTSEKPLSVVDRFFSALGKALRSVWKLMSERYGRSFEPEAEMKAFLDEAMETIPNFGAEQWETLQLESLRQAQEAVDRAGAPETPVVPITESTGGGRAILEGAGAGWEGREMAAHADRYQKWWSWALSILQMAKLNPHIRGLQLYTELNKISHLVSNTIKSEAMQTLEPWKRLDRDSPKQSEALGKFIDDYMNGRFMPEAERAQGLRKPTPDEMRALIARHGLEQDTFRIFNRMAADFDRSLDRIKELLRRDAMRIVDPLKQAEALDAVDAQIKAMKSRPYMPAFRFGDFSVTVYDKDGNVKHFETFETIRARDRAAEELRKLAGDTDKVLPGFIKKDVRPLLGLPPALLRAMGEKLKLSDSQKAAMKELLFEYAPAQSFRHRFQKKDLVPGYSQDWQRAYANYMFHFSNYFTRAAYADMMRDQIHQVWQERFNRADATKIDQIRNFMGAHLDSVLDPKADWSTARGMMFHWYLGFSPSAALVNMTQTPLVTLPYLGAKFGDAKAFGAMTRATTNLNTFYRKANLLNATERDLRALGEAVREGILEENQAHALAGISERSLTQRFGNSAERAWYNFSEYSAYFFRMAEEYNRRIAFRAGWDLALQDVTSPHVKAMVETNQLQYGRLRAKGWSHEEAAAFTAAKDAVESTQFVYAPFARPKLLQGRVGSLFVFKSFIMNTLFLLGSNPTVGARNLLLLTAAAGVGGIPFAEDIKSLIKGLAARFIGKDWDIEKEARKFILDVSKGNIRPDLILHGASHYGFGIPQIADMLGGLVDWDVPIPNVDLSRSIGMGRISPIDVGRLFQPSKDVAGTTVRELQRASGAMFGLGFSMYNFLTRNPWEEPEWKKFEQILPRAMGNASAAVRYLTQGEEKNRLGNAVLRFDPNDSTHAAEAIARGLGFMPTRLSERYDNLAAKAEAVALWDIKRELLMRQYGAAFRAGSRESMGEVKKRIVTFNRELPPDLRAKAISGENLKQSIQNRLRVERKQERGLPTSPRNIGIYREIDRLYPGGAAPPGIVDVKRVR